MKTKILVPIVMSLMTLACSNNYCDSEDENNGYIEVKPVFKESTADEKLILPVTHVSLGSEVVWTNEGCKTESCPKDSWVDVLALSNQSPKKTKMQLDIADCDSTSSYRDPIRYSRLTVHLIEVGFQGVEYNSETYGGFPDEVDISLRNTVYASRDSNRVEMLVIEGAIVVGEDELNRIDCSNYAPESGFAGNFNDAFCSERKPLCNEDKSKCLDLNKLMAEAEFLSIK